MTCPFTTLICIMIHEWLFPTAIVIHQNSLRNTASNLSNSCFLAIARISSTYNSSRYTYLFPFTHLKIEGLTLHLMHPNAQGTSSVSHTIALTLVCNHTALSLVYSTVSILSYILSVIQVYVQYFSLQRSHTIDVHRHPAHLHLTEGTFYVNLPLCIFLVTGCYCQTGHDRMYAHYKGWVVRIGQQVRWLANHLTAHDFAIQFSNYLDNWSTNFLTGLFELSAIICINPIGIKLSVYMVVE